MKKLVVFISIAMPLLLACIRPENKGKENGNMISSPTGDTCLAKAIAEKILGQPAHLTESLSAKNDNVLQHKCTYTADSIDNMTNEPGNLYYMYEEYKDSTAAKNAFEHIWAGNKDMPGIEKLAGAGDDAFLHSDKTNFHLVIFRKANKMLRFKVNKVTGRTSLDELIRTAKTIASAI